MADKYWFLDETPKETPDLGGYSFGTIDNDNPAPEGAQVLPNKTQLNKVINASEKAWKSAVDAAVVVDDEDTEKTNNGIGKGSE